MADETRRVQGGFGLIERVEIVPEARETPCIVAQQIERRRVGRDERRQTDAAIAGHHGRDALRELRMRTDRIEQEAVVVRMNVDEARHDDAPAGIDPFACEHRLKRAQQNDPAVFDAHVARAARRACAVDQHSVFYHHV